MEYLLYQALNSLICISSAKQVSAQAVTQLVKYGCCFFHCNKEIEAQQRDFLELGFGFFPSL